jgi:hypothetical protein
MAEQHHKTPPADDTEPRVTTPYGPHHGHVDEAAGGADSSPFDTEPSDHQLDEARKPIHEGKPGVSDPHREG